MTMTDFVFKAMLNITQKYLFHRVPGVSWRAGEEYPVVRICQVTGYLNRLNKSNSYICDRNIKS